MSSAPSAVAILTELPTPQDDAPLSLVEQIVELPAVDLVVAEPHVRGAAPLRSRHGGEEVPRRELVQPRRPFIAQQCVRLARARLAEREARPAPTAIQQKGMSMFGLFHTGWFVHCVPRSNAHCLVRRCNARSSIANEWIVMGLH